MTRESPTVYGGELSITVFLSLWMALTTAPILSHVLQENTQSSEAPSQQLFEPSDRGYPDISYGSATR